MYDEIAGWYDWLYSYKDYEAEVRRLVAHVEEYHRHATSVLDVACGTGRHLELLGGRFDVAGVDISARMLALARKRLPEAELVHSDMRSFELGRTFDVVSCLFGSISLLRTLDQARIAVANMARHVAPGGLLILEPWVTDERWEEGRVDAAVNESPQGKIATVSNSTRSCRIARVDMHHLVATTESVEHIEDPLEAGVWSEHEYGELVRENGFVVHYDDEGLMGRGLFVGLKPA